LDKKIASIVLNAPLAGLLLHFRILVQTFRTSSKGTIFNYKIVLIFNLTIH